MGEPSLRVELLGDVAGLRAARGEPISEILRELDALVVSETEPYLVGSLHWARYWAAWPRAGSRALETSSTD